MLRRVRVRTSCLLAAVLAWTSLAACEKGDPETLVVAEVGDEEITVEQAADYMARSGHGLNLEDVAKAVDELIDFHLVRERARERHKLSVRESLQVKEWGEILLVNQFREDVIWSTVAVDEAKLREWYDENVSDEVQARHILVGVAPSAAEAERVAARREADSLHAALQGGADFAAAARTHSDDPGSAQQGGLMRWFRKGEMVESFEKASFEGEVGKLYPEVVESPFGFHVIKVEDRRRPPFEELREDIENQLVGPQRGEAEQAYVTRLMETSGVEFYEENIDRFIALLDEDPPRPPSAEERELDLTTFRSGAITFGEIYDLYNNLPDNNKQAIEQLDQTQMIQALAALMQQRLMLTEARAKKVELDTTRQKQLDERIDALYVEAYLREASRAQLEIPDSVVQQYYDEHREFYAGQPFEVVKEQIRQVLLNQRMDALSGPEAQRELVAAVADSQAPQVEVVRHEDRYGDVLERLRQKYEEMGQDPDAAGTQPEPAAPSGPPQGAAQPGQGPPPGAAQPGQGAPPGTARPGQPNDAQRP